MSAKVLTSRTELVALENKLQQNGEPPHYAVLVRNDVFRRIKYHRPHRIYKLVCIHFDCIQQEY